MLSFTDTCMSIDTARARKAVTSLRTYQTGYPDYDAEDWSTAVLAAHKAPSVRAVAMILVSLGSWSLRGIEISQRDLGKRAGVSQKSVSNSVTRLVSSGHIKVSRRYAKRTDHGYSQKPDSYQLIIPDGPTWGVADTTGVVAPLTELTEVIGSNGLPYKTMLFPEDDQSPYIVSNFSQETTYADDGLFPWERGRNTEMSAAIAERELADALAGGETGERDDGRAPFAWEWEHKGWTTP